MAQYDLTSSRPRATSGAQERRSSKESLLIWPTHGPVIAVGGMPAHANPGKHLGILQQQHGVKHRRKQRLHQHVVVQGKAKQKAHAVVGLAPPPTPTSGSLL
jgi:hypothetical protein